MKYLVLTIWAIGLLSCGGDITKEQPVTVAEPPMIVEVPDTVVELTSLQYHNKVSLWTLGTELYSGYAVTYYQDSVLKQRTAFVDGRKQNISSHYYPDGHLQRIASYHKGKLHGEKKSWSVDSVHVLISHLRYERGKLHGEQKMWYPTGELYKVLHMVMGREQGLQRAYRKNGDLYANYEAKEGRTFGLRKAALCYGLEDEKIEYER